MITIERPMNRRAFLQVEPMPALMFEGERFAHKFVISPEEEGGFAGCSVTARMMLPDGENVAVEGGLDVSGNACVVLTPACYAVPGKVVLSIYTVSGEETVCVYSCTGFVIPTLGRKGNAEEPAAPIVEAYTDPAIAEIRQQIAALQAAVDAIPVRQGSGEDAVTAGLDTVASGTQSAAFGKGTIATQRSNFVVGEYNVEDTTAPNVRNGSVFVVGNGTESKRSNAFAVYYSGSAEIGGALTIGTAFPGMSVQLTPQKLKALLALLD